jgi:hypothetical protein
MARDWKVLRLPGKQVALYTGQEGAWRRLQFSTQEGGDGRLAVRSWLEWRRPTMLVNTEVLSVEDLSGRDLGNVAGELIDVVARPLPEDVEPGCWVDEDEHGRIRREVGPVVTAFLDGLLAHRSLELLPHGWHCFDFRRPLPARWAAADSGCGLLDRYLRVYPAELGRLLLEALAYVCFGSPGKHLLLLDGPSGSGKSTFAAFAEALVGTSNTASVNGLFSLTGQFGLAPLVDRELLVVNEVEARLPTGQRDAQVILKVLSGGDSVEIHRKYVDSFSVRLRIKTILLANHVPSGLSDPAVHARLVRLRLPSLGEAAKTLPRADELAASQELRDQLPAMYRRLHGVWQGCQRQDGRVAFSLDPEAQEELRAHTEPPVAAIFRDAFVVTADPADRVDQDTAMQLWRGTCERHGYAELAKLGRLREAAQSAGASFCKAHAAGERSYFGRVRPAEGR